MATSSEHLRGSGSSDDCASAESFWQIFKHGDTTLSHRELLAALEKRDGEAAEVAFRTHIERSRQLLPSLFSGN